LNAGSTTIGSSGFTISNGVAVAGSAVASAARITKSAFIVFAKNVYNVF
jgi:hypothetical protein